MDNNNSAETRLQQYDFFTDWEYRADLNSRLQRAQTDTRILLMSMTFDPSEPAVREIIDNVQLAAERGAHVLIGIDAHSFMLDGEKPGPLFYNSNLSGNLPPRFQAKQAVLDALNQQPTGTAVILNMPGHAFSLPVGGRSHIKIAMVDDYFYLGGCNLEGTDAVDVMVGIKNQAVADQLYGLLSQILNAKQSRHGLHDLDQEVVVDKYSKIVVDAGVPGQSKILNKTLAIIDRAVNHVFVANQFFPNGNTAHSLQLASQRGADVKIVYTHPSSHTAIGAIGQTVNVLIEKLRLPKSLFAYGLTKQDPTVHAKIVATEEAGVIGSHNYVKAGVRLGTAEITLFSYSPDFSKQLAQTFYRSLEQKRRL